MLEEALTAFLLAPGLALAAAFFAVVAFLAGVLATGFDAEAFFAEALAAGFFTEAAGALTATVFSAAFLGLACLATFLSTMPASGGTRRTMDCSRPFHATSSQRRRPSFITPEPPNSAASELNFSAYTPHSGTPRRKSSRALTSKLMRMTRSSAGSSPRRTKLTMDWSELSASIHSKPPDS